MIETISRTIAALRLKIILPIQKDFNECLLTSSLSFLWLTVSILDVVFGIDLYCGCKHEIGETGGVVSAEQLSHLEG